MDKLFEDWRKYLLVEFKGDPADYAPEPPEEEHEEEEALPKPSLDPAEGRGALEAALSYIRTHKEEMESAADREIEQLPSVSEFWKEIFDADDWDRTDSDMAPRSFDAEGRLRGIQAPPEGPKRAAWEAHKAKKPSESPEDIVKRYHENGTLKGSLSEWLDLTTFVLVCRQTNIDETKMERVQKFTDFMGAGATTLSKAIKWTLIAAGVGTAIITTGPLWIGAAITVWGIGGDISTFINDRVREKDMIELSNTLGQKLNISRPLHELGVEDFDMAKAVTLEDDFHDAEFQIMRILNQSPHSLPRVMSGRTGKMGDFRSALSEEEQKLYDRWRQLLTEDKK